MHAKGFLGKNRPNKTVEDLRELSFQGYESNEHFYNIQGVA
jgi:hypothetical protein